MEAQLPQSYIAKFEKILRREWSEAFSIYNFPDDFILVLQTMDFGSSFSLSPASEASRLIRNPNSFALSRLLSQQRNLGVYFRTLNNFSLSDTEIDERLLEELFEPKRQNKKNVEVIIESKFRAWEGERLKVLPEMGAEHRTFDNIRSANDFQSFLKENYKAYRSLVDSSSDNSDSMVPRSISPTSFHIIGQDDSFDFGASMSGYPAKREKNTSDTDRSGRQGSFGTEDFSSKDFTKKTRIFLK